MAVCSHQIKFVQNLRDQVYADRVALSDGQNVVTYGELYAEANNFANHLSHITNAQRKLALLYMSQSITSVVHYLGCLLSGVVPVLLHENMKNSAKEAFIASFTPHLIISDDGDVVLHDDPLNIDSRVSVLLATSGTTGAGKCVALSARNINENAHSICQFLPIEQSDNTLASLPFSYSYGLSILHTHLLKGAHLVLSELTPFQRGFWQLLQETPIHSFAGVPSWYEMLIRMKFEQHSFPSLRYFTQAGGRLPTDLVKSLATHAGKLGINFYVMYGQTEATARMAYLCPQQLLNKPNSIGKAIPGGNFSLLDDKGNSIHEPETVGELCYQGENVMLGYVSSAEGLSNFIPAQRLNTGDLAKFDSDGDYYIVGRIKRIIKIFGERVGLDEVEANFERKGIPVKAFGEDNTLVLAYLDKDKNKVIDILPTILPFSPRNIFHQVLESWPLLENGKVDYVHLKQTFNTEWANK